MSFGAKISKPGFDAKTADPENLVLSSDFSSFKIEEVLYDQFVKTGNFGENFEITHGLGYTPAYFCFVKSNGRWWGDLGEEPVNGLEWVTWVDDDKFYIYCINGDTEVFDVKVFLLIDESALTAGETQFADPYGLKISKPGVDVKTAYDQELVFGTKFQTFKVIDIITFEYAGESGEKTQPHGLGYVPAWSAICTSDSLGLTIPLPYLLVGNHEIHVWSDDTNIGTRIETILPGGETATIKVVLFDNQLE